MADPLQAAAAAASAVPKLPAPDVISSTGDSAQLLGEPVDSAAATTDTPDLASNPQPTPGTSAASQDGEQKAEALPEKDLLKMIPRSGVVLAPIASGKSTLATTDSRFRDVDDIRAFPDATPDERETMNTALYNLGMAGLHDAYDGVWQPLVKEWARAQPEDTLLLVHTPRDALSTGRPIVAALLPPADELEARYANRSGRGWGDQPERMKEIARANARGVAEQADALKLPVFTSIDDLREAVAPVPSTSSPTAGPPA